MSTSMRRALRALNQISDNFGPKRGFPFGPEQQEARTTVITGVFFPPKEPKELTKEQVPTEEETYVPVQEKS